MSEKKRQKQNKETSKQQNIPKNSEPKDTADKKKEVGKYTANPVKKESFNKLLVRTVLVAAVAVIIVIFGLMLSGLRYSKATDNAGTTAKFFGWVDEAGNMEKGTLYFSGTRTGTGKINIKDHSIIYSNGDVYVGEIANGFPNGQGKMSFYNGDIYEGSYVNGVINGQGKFTYS
ncbi:MAG: hypothetical protein IKU19_08385, partial [Clostridia bacterium]|nr:hypothetical protein [Clostridia bacterium]